MKYTFEAGQLVVPQPLAADSRIQLGLEAGQVYHVQEVHDLGVATYCTIRRVSGVGPVVLANVLLLKPV